MKRDITYSEDFFRNLSVLTEVPLEKIHDYAKDNNPFNILEHPMVVEPNEKQMEKINRLNEFIKSYGVLRMQEEQCKIRFNSPEDSGRYFLSLLGNMKDKERLMVAFMDNARGIIETRTISEGSTDMVVVYPRDILKIAISNDCAGLILAHNHPGEPRPSREDIALTQRIVDIFSPLQIHVLDHIIVGGGRYTSMADMAEKGYLPNSPLNKANYDPILLRNIDKAKLEHDKGSEMSTTEEEEELEL